MFTGLASAQEQRFRPQGTALQTGTPIEREMAVGQVHSFIVTSPEDSFVQIAVEQRGIDVVVSVFSPAGKKLGEYDSPTGTEGTENVSFTAIEKGTYRIQVTPLERDQDTPAGRFQIKIVELRAATEEELAAGKNLDALKIRAVALLGEVELLMTELRVPQTRIMAQLQAAQMLWEVDEKRAIKYTNDAMTGVRELYASIDPNSKEYFKNYHGIAYLRSAIIQTVLQRQPELALSFLRSTPPLTDPFGNQPDPFSQDGSLEADIANQLLKTDPKRTLELVRETLKTRLSANVSSVLSNLKPKYPELAAELANEIATRLLSEKLLTNNQASSLLINLLHIA
ncbi:MAG TPA: PPC domain-containing protein, partial [Pyrinomonadaceae bacterium]|nr:PPC domain-containing protein [Pyrinomonadaceae bacterium]